MADLRRVLNMLSLARRAGELLIGQDKIFEAMRRGAALAVFVSSDCSANVMRKLGSAQGRGCAEVYGLKDTDRERLGNCLGVSAAQAAALPRKSGLAEKIIMLMNEDRSDADE